MKKYFFGVQRFVVDANNRKAPKMYWGKGYDTAEQAVDANKEFMVKHLGEKFTLGCFEVEETSEDKPK